MHTPVAMVAGEASGDLLAGLLLASLKVQVAGLHAYGIGGSNMTAEGFHADWSSDRLAVRGYVEVLRHYRDIAAIRKKLKAKLLAEPPRAFIGIDAPDFNLDLEIALRNAWQGSGHARGYNIPVIHFVSPSIWAWRGKRIAKIARAVDHMLVLFPFEEKLYRDAGIAATYVGHPLADVIPMHPDRGAARDALGLPRDARVAALLPGSRLSEIAYIAPSFIAAAKLLHVRNPQLRFVAPMAGAATRAAFMRIVEQEGHGLPLVVTDRQTHARGDLL